MRRLLPLVVLQSAVAAGCASAPPPPAVAPSAPASAPAPTSQAPAPEPAQRGAVAPAAVPPPPPACAELVAHPVTSSDHEWFRAALAAALATDDVTARDAALGCLESREEAAPGLVRALRAELGPEACADALVTPVLQSPPRGLSTDLEQVYLGLMIAGRLSRLLADAPTLEPPFDKDRFRAFFADRLSPWVLAQAAAIEKLSLDGARLVGYGRGLAAIAAGNADLRFVDMVRSVPLPEDMKADREATDAYYGALDQALDPRKLRGRDAALVGLRAFADLGALHEPRVVRARQLLDKLWSGSRIDALDRLLLPPLDQLDVQSPERVLAARLPSFYAQKLLPDVDPTDPKLLRALLERGVPPAFRAKLAVATLSPEARVLGGRAFLDSGRTYFRAQDFKAARSVLEAGKTNDAGALLAAVARALENGPVDATELMLKGPFVRGTGDVSALDAEAQRRTRYSSYAAFDAALIVELAPLKDDPAFWDGLAARFLKAEKLLAASSLPLAPDEAKTAREYADAARATALVLRGKH